MNIDEIGFVTMDDILNVFTIQLDKIEAYYKKNGPPGDYREFLETLYEIKDHLVSRAKSGAVDYIRKNPELKKEIRDTRAAEIKKEERLDWKDRVRQSRDKYYNSDGSYKGS